MSVVRIYSAPTCPYCIAAERLFDNLGVEYSEIRIDRDPALRKRLMEENEGWRTVPMIFIGDRFIGGFTEVQNLQDDDRLMPLINESCLSNS